MKHKTGVVRTLAHRAKSVVSAHGERQEELDRIKETLRHNGHPEWMLAETREEKKDLIGEGEEDVKEMKSSGKNKERKKTPVVLPYVRGFSKQLRRTFGNF